MMNPVLSQYFLLFITASRFTFLVHSEVFCHALFERVCMTDTINFITMI